MKILSAIFSPLGMFFNLLVEQYLRKKDWQVVGVCPCTWSEQGVEKGRLSYTLLENGLRQRKVKMSSTLPDNPKTHRFYSLAIFPWLQGATIKGLPDFRGSEGNVSESSSILPPLTVKKAKNGTKMVARKASSAVRIGNNVLQVDFTNRNR